MRKDFDKVITEDPRRGGVRKFREIRHSKGNEVFDEEFSGGKESIMQRRRIAGGERKQFGDHLAPLRGFMRSKVGQCWDDVYSEICRTFDQRKQTNAHILQHVQDDFLTKVVLINGEIYRVSTWAQTAPLGTSPGKYVDFYVHPLTGILCSNHKENEVGTKKRLKAKREAFREQQRLARIEREKELAKLTAIEEKFAWVYKL